MEAGEVKKVKITILKTTLDKELAARTYTQPSPLATSAE
jgi:hypothetical protein